MPALPQTRPDRIDLTVSSPGEVERRPSGPGRIPHLPWLLAAVGWAAAAAFLGLAAMALLVVPAWLTALRVPLATVLDAAGQGWLAAHGVRVEFGKATLQLIPLGYTLLLVAACAVVAHHAGIQARSDAASRRSPWWRWAGVTGVVAVTYTLVCGVLASLVADPGQAIAVLPGAAIIAVVGAAYGACRGLDLDPLGPLPLWIRRLPQAVGVGAATMAVGSLVLLVTALVAHGDRVVASHEAFAPDLVGGVLLVVVQLAFWPNLLLWAGAYALGVGVSLGDGSAVSMAGTSMGALPGIPVFAAIPEQPVPEAWAWLLVGVLAGAASAWWLVRGLPVEEPADRDHWLWQAAVAGGLTGAVWAGLSALSRGDLGTGRLVGLGPQLPETIWMALMLMAISGGVAGLVCYALAGRRLASPDDGDDR